MPQAGPFGKGMVSIPMADNDKFIIALTRHRFLGDILQPYIVTEQPVGMIVKGLAQLGEEFSRGVVLTPLQKELTRLATKCSTSQLARKFSRDTAAADFFTPANSAIVDKMVIPWVQKQMYRMALLLMDGKTPLYYKDPQYSRIYEEDRIAIAADFCRPLFSFRRTPEGTFYRLKLYAGTGEVGLIRRELRMLSVAPCAMVADNQLLLFEKLDAPKIKPFTSQEEIHIPPALEEKYYTTFILPVLRDFEADTRGFILRELPLVPVPLLSLENDLAMLPAMMLKFRYGEEVFPAVARNKTIVKLERDPGGYQFTRVTRDADAERGPAEFLQTLGLKVREAFYTLPGIELMEREKAVAFMVDWISDHHEEFKKRGFELATTGLGKRYFTGTRQIVMDVKAQPDWFDVFAVAQIGDFRIPFLKLRKYLLGGIREFELPDGSIAILPEEWFARYRFLVPFARGNGNQFTLQHHHYSLLTSLGLASGMDAVHAVEEQFKTMEEIPLPEGLNAGLRAYQVMGYRWMVTLMKNHLGGCLSDDMGLGKTLQAIALLLRVSKKRTTPPAGGGEITITTSGEEMTNRAGGGEMTNRAGGKEMSIRAGGEVRQLSLFGPSESPGKPSTRGGRYRKGRLSGEALPLRGTGETDGVSGEAPRDEAVKTTFPLEMKGDRQELPTASLVVMPASLIHNWQAELRRFAPSLRVYCHTGAQRNRLPDPARIVREYDVILTTYGTIRNDYAQFSGTLFRCVILDESQYIKNPSSKSYRAVMELNAAYRFVLTGTPIENSLSDLWAQMNFLNRGLLGNFPFFRQNFMVPIENKGDSGVADQLRELVRPFILRRTKAEVASDLPPLMEQTILCSMTDGQRSLYEKEKSLIRNSILANIEDRGIERSSLIILQAMTRLRQIAIHPQLLKEQEDADSGKYNEIMEALLNLVAENHKVLVFSSFVTHLELIRQGIVAAGLKYSLLTGKTTNRGEVIRAFQEDPGNYIFLISMKAGGVGLNLTSAGYVFIVDPWWNPAVEEQALSRAHRIGQVQNTFVYRFISGETIEEKIGKLKIRKQSLADRFINRNNPLGTLSQEEVLELIE